MIPWTVARQAPLSMGSPREECWSGLPFPDLHWLDPYLLTPPALVEGFFTTEPPRKSTECVAVLCLVAQLCPTLFNPMDYSLPDTSVRGDSPGKNTGVRISLLTPIVLICIYVSACIWLYHAACRILVPRPGIQPTSPAMEAQSLNN